LDSAVDPIKPTFQAPESKRLTLIYDERLSSLAFNFNVRRYTMVTLPFLDGVGKIHAYKAGAYTRPLFSST
jgi:hypothetical protein